MDNEIIIGGVNVENCSYYNKDNYPYCCEVWDNECEAQNCYYKQLQQLKAENERLKEENKTLNALSDVLEEDNKKLSSEKDALYNNSLQAVKEDLVQRVWNLQKQYTEIVSKFEIESLTDNTTGETFYRSMKLYKLKSCLQEIKEIAEFHITQADSEDVQEDMKQILQKISEVE